MKILVTGGFREWSRIWTTSQAAGEPQEEALSIKFGAGNYLKVIEDVLGNRGYR